MRKNLPVFPHRRAGFAGAPALFPAVWIIEKLCLATFGSVLSERARGRDKPGRPCDASNVGMRKNLPVFPHRRAGCAGAAALFPAVGIIEELRPDTFGSVLSKRTRGRDKPGRPCDARNAT